MAHLIFRKVQQGHTAGRRSLVAGKLAVCIHVYPSRFCWHSTCLALPHGKLECSNLSKLLCCSSHMAQSCCLFRIGSMQALAGMSILTTSDPHRQAQVLISDDSASKCTTLVRHLLQQLCQSYMRH